MILPDPDTCYRAVSSRDERFDGWFFTGVRTTGIYCRPSCPATTPRRRNVDFHPSAAAAQRAGFRACKRCRPDASPGSPEWDVRGDLAGRALRLIADGLLDREGVPGLARRLGYSERQVNRTLLAEVGAGPLALARSQRAQTARILLETTALPAADIAFAAGFTSVRQFNDTVREVFATTPTGLRAAGHRVAEPGALTLRLAYRRPMDVQATLDFLGRRCVDGLESYDGSTYTRTLALPGGSALVAVRAGAGFVQCTLRLDAQRDLVAAVSRVRRLLDLDADPVAVQETLSGDPALSRLVARRPGLRSPGAVDGFEMAVRAVVGQQVSVHAAATVLARMVREHGRPAFPGEAWMLFPAAGVLAEVATLPMPTARTATVRALSRSGIDLDPGADRTAVRTALLALPGVGPWTADYLLMRAIGDPDVLLHTDLGVRRTAERLGIDLATNRPDWAPWRSYATHHIWSA